MDLETQSWEWVTYDSEQFPIDDSDNAYII